MGKEWFGIVGGIAGGLVVSGLYENYPWLGYTFLSLGLVLFGLLFLVATLRLLLPWSLRSWRRLVVGFQMRKETDDWIPVSLAASWLAANAGPFLRRRLHEPLAPDPIAYCVAIWASQINSGLASAQGVRPEKSSRQEVPANESFRIVAENPNTLLAARYGTFERAFEDVVVRKCDLSRVRLIADELHAHYRDKPVPAIEVAFTRKAELQGLRLENVASGASLSNCVESKVSDSSATGIGAAGGVGFEFIDSPDAVLKKVEATGFPSGYRFDRSPRPLLDDVKANGQEVDEPSK